MRVTIVALALAGCARGDVHPPAQGSDASKAQVEGNTSPAVSAAGVSAEPDLSQRAGCVVWSKVAGHDAPSITEYTVHDRELRTGARVVARVDAAGRLVREESLEYELDAQGQRARIFVVSETDGTRRLIARHQNRYRDGKLEGFTLLPERGTATRSDLAYDAQGRVVEIVTRSSARPEPQTRSFQYDADGRLSEIAVRIGKGASEKRAREQLTRDPRGRIVERAVDGVLTEASSADGTVDFSEHWVYAADGSLARYELRGEPTDIRTPDPAPNTPREVRLFSPGCREAAALWPALYKLTLPSLPPGAQL